MLDCSCTNACALNGLPGPMRHWFTGFTHSLTRLAEATAGFDPDADLSEHLKSG